MDVSHTDAVLIEALCDGLERVPRPYHALGAQLGLAEDEVTARLKRLIEVGVIRRLGVVVQHRKLGYKANAMTVWDIPDDAVAEVGPKMGAYPFVTLCYRRPRHAPDWPYNLFAMVHGAERDAVLAQVEQITADLGLTETRRDVLFSRKQFKQRGAKYACKWEAAE